MTYTRSLPFDTRRHHLTHVIIAITYLNNENELSVRDGRACSGRPRLPAGRPGHVCVTCGKREHQRRYHSATSFGFATGKAGRDAQRSGFWITFKPFARPYQSK